MARGMGVSPEEVIMMLMEQQTPPGINA